MSFGFGPALADTLWLRWIQDADTCYAYFSQADVEPAGDSKDVLFNPRHKKCDDSWGFKMLDAITKLDPKFMMPYRAGAMALSVLVEDYEGASIIFNRGIENYPNDWQLNYRASYHFLFDKHDLKRSADLLRRAGELGGPSWLQSLAARLYSKTGQLELGLIALTNFRKAYPEGHVGLKEVDRRISEMKAELERERGRK